jgi:hypothetical protein
MKQQNIIEKNKSSSFYPRIIREFEDERDEQPMFYGGQR